jgi:hypothetical protein
MTGEGSSYYGSGSRGDYGRTSGAFTGSSGYTGSGYSSEGWGGSSMGRSSGYGENYRSGSFTGSGSFAGRGPRTYQRSDERIREEVNERLTDDPRVDASDIDVEVRNGEVFLRGRVDERRDKRAAEEIVENLPGVKDVRNELRVERSSEPFGGSDRDRQQGDRNRQEGDRNRQEGSLGHTGNPQQRDDVTSLNLSGASTQSPAAAAGREKSEKK